MKAMKQSLFDEFQIKGYWWLPESDEEVPGILFYSQENMYLELLGALESKDLFLENSTREIILGRSDKGEEFTLLNARTKNATANYPGYPTESYHIGSFLVGGIFDSKKEINFDSAIFTLTYLTKWLNRPIFIDETRYDKDTNDIIEKQVRYNETPLFKHYVSSLKSTIEESFLFNFGGDLSESVSWKHIRRVKITPDAGQGFDWFYENMFLLKDLFSLFIGHGLYFQDIKFFGEEIMLDSSKTFRKPYKYFFRQNKIKVKSKFDWSDIMVEFSEVEDDFSNVINMWFEKHQVLQTVYEFYFSNFYKEIYLDTTFLNTVQTLEIYHRKNFEGKIFDKDVFRDLSTQLKEYTNDHFPDDFSKKIRDMLAFGNEYSLAMRLQELINNFEAETKERLIGDSDAVKKFVRQIVDTRNYLTHFDKNKKKNVLEETDEKFLAIKRLIAITTVILFKEIGINESLIVNKVCDSKQYSFVLSKAMKVLN